MTADPPAGAGIDDRIAARRRTVRADRRAVRRRRTVRVLVAVLVLAALVLVERSPLVGLESVTVTGVERLEVAQVRDVAQLEPGTSTLRLRLGAVERRVTELPLVASVTARRVDPLTVEIAVVERTPVFRTAGSDPHLLDRAGTVIAPADGSVDVPDGLVELSIGGDPPQLGSTPGAGTATGSGVRVWRELTGPLRVEIEAVDVSGGGEVSLSLRTGVEVLIGRAERIDEKARALGAVLEDLDDTAVRRIDVTAPNRPAVTP